MSDVDWLALWSEFAQAIDNEQLKLIAAARQIHQRARRRKIVTK